MVLPRLRAVSDLLAPEARETAGLHEYDGAVVDLSPAGVRSALSRLGRGKAPEDPHDAAHLEAVETGLRTAFELVEEHRWNPLVHIANLDLAGYDRLYAPAGERQAARLRHLSAWPDGVDAAIESLDRVPAPVAAALLGAAEGLLPNAKGPNAEDRHPDVPLSAVAAHRRLVEHLRDAATNGPPDIALGSIALSRLMGDPEATVVDLDELAGVARAERARVTGLLEEACGRLRPGATPAALLPELLADHPDADGIYDEARALMAEATTFTAERDLLPDLGGECLVGPAPPSRRWAMAMMSWAAPFEADAPAWYHVNPPDPSWPEEEQEEWLSVFSRTTLPAITVHEVTPGHFAHSRLLRRARGDVRRSLFSSAFVEGWAHHTEELMVEEGFRSDDPRFAIGVHIEALVRVTRLEVAIGVHSGDMEVPEAAMRFERDAYLRRPGARSEVERASFDPTYGRYTWGKLAIRSLREDAKRAWGGKYTHRRFHERILALGAPPLGLIGAALKGDGAHADP